MQFRGNQAGSRGVKGISLVTAPEHLRRNVQHGGFQALLPGGFKFLSQSMRQDGNAAANVIPAVLLPMQTADFLILPCIQQSGRGV